MQTEPHILESLSRAYIRAIAGKACLNLSIREYDYGVDGNFDEITIRNSRVIARFDREGKNRGLVMTKQIFPEQLQIHNLEITDVVAYLQQNGWQTVTHPNPPLLVFQGSADDEGNPIQLILPSQNTFEDSERLLAKAINLLAVIEDKSPQAIIDLITQTHANSTVGT